MEPNGEAISVILLPDAKGSELLVACSDAVVGAAKSHAWLDSNNLPHITIAQFAAPQHGAESLWNEMKQLRGKVSEVQVGGLCFLPSHRDDKMWVEVQILKSAKLQDLQNQVLQAEFARRFEILNGHGDDFRPHCTLALLENKVIPELNLENFQDFRKQYKNLTLAVAINGEEYSLRNIAFS